MFETKKGEMQEGSYQDVAALPMWKGNLCLLTFSSVDGNHAFCVWQCKAGTTLSEFQVFIDEFAGSAAKNIPTKIDAVVGGDNLNFETYVHDVQKLGKDGHVHPYAGEGDLWFIPHKHEDKADWEQYLSEKFTAAKGKHNAAALSEAWRFPTGLKNVLSIVLSDGEGALCIADVPKDFTEAEFKKAVVDFTGEGSKNGPLGKVDPTTALNSRVLHPDFYAQEVSAYAEAFC